MKVMLWPSTIVRGTPEERRDLRPLGRNTGRYQDMLAELESLAVMADEYGLDAFANTEHHLHTEGGESLPNSLLLYAKLASRTERLMFIPLSVVLPARDPIRVAEDIALFDHMYPGRVAVCFARGYQTRWMQTLAQRTGIASGPMDREADETNRAVFEEHLEVVLKAWTEDAFTFDGEHYQVPYPATGIPGWPAAEWTREFGSAGEIDADGTLRRSGVIPRPLSSPHPPIFVPYTLSATTLSRAARRGFTIMVYDGRPERFLAACRAYRDEAAAAGRDLALGQGVTAVRKIFLGDSFEEAFELAVRTAGFWFNRYFSVFGFAEVNRTSEHDPDRRVSFSSDRECVAKMYETGQLLCGTPDQVSGQLESLARCHADGGLEWLAWEFLTQAHCTPDEQRRQLDLFATRVLPRFR